jgi:hypothetical protein
MELIIRDAEAGQQPLLAGIIDLFTDIFGVAYQFGHDCNQGPSRIPRMTLRRRHRRGTEPARSA